MANHKEFKVKIEEQYKTLTCPKCQGSVASGHLKKSDCIAKAKELPEVKKFTSDSLKIRGLLHYSKVLDNLENQSKTVITQTDIKQKEFDTLLEESIKLGLIK